jgi:hypothetical protein
MASGLAMKIGSRSPPKIHALSATLDIWSCNEAGKSAGSTERKAEAVKSIE